MIKDYETAITLNEDLSNISPETKAQINKLSDIDSRLNIQDNLTVRWET